MNWKKGLKIGAIVLGSAALLYSANFCYKVYNIHKNQEKKWVPQEVYQRSQTYHPCEQRVLRSIILKGNEDIFEYKESYLSCLAFFLGSNLESKLGFENLLGWSRLTNNPAIDKDPSFSPDGKHIVFSSNRDGNFNIYLIDKNKQIKKITNGKENKISPIWINKNTIKYHVTEDNKTFYETIDIENLKLVEKEEVKEGYQVGDKAINFTAEDISGKKYTLDDYLGNIVLLNFFTTWCPGCIKEVPSMIKFYEKKPQDIELLSISHEYFEILKEFAEKNRINYPVLVDKKEIFEKYKIYGIPQTFILDKKGKINKRYIGFLDFTSEEFKNYLNNLLQQ